MPELTRAAIAKLSKRVSALVAPSLSVAPVSVHGPNRYFCTSWRINGREGRELFLELPRSASATSVLRIGLYFRDSASVCRVASNRAQLTAELLKNQRKLSLLGIRLTSSRRGLDEREFGWTTSELRRWLLSPGHKDVVRRWDLRNELPAPRDVSSVLKGLGPLWRLVNELDRRSLGDALDEGARRHIVHELARRDPRLVKDARREHGTTCLVCGFSFGTFYGERGRDFIEVHHLKPIAAGRRRTSTKDVTVVCANCHRMLHRGPSIMTVSKLKRIVTARKRLSRLHG